MKGETKTHHYHSEINNGCVKAINVGDYWRHLSGILCRVVAVPRKGIASCEGCIYLESDGTVDCHKVPPCKWWTRHDGTNVIFKPIKTPTTSPA